MTGIPFARRTGRYRGSALLLLLCLVTALFATGVPALVARSQTSSIQQALNAAGPLQRAVLATTSHQYILVDGNRLGEAQAGNVTPDPDSLSGALQDFEQPLPADAGAEPSQAWSGVQLADPLPFPAQGQDAQINLEYRSSLSSHVRLVAGTLPTGVTRDSENNTYFSVAISAATAKLYGAHVGSMIKAGNYAINVTGVFEPTDPDSAFWAYDSTLLNPLLLHQRGQHDKWSAAALIGADELLPLATTGDPHGGLETTDIEFCVPLDTATYNAANVGRIISDLNAFDSGEAPLSITATATAGPIAVLTPLQNQRTAIDAILGLVMAAVAAIGAVTVLLCARLVVGRRRAHFALLRARGQSRLQLARQACVGLGLPNLIAIALAAAAVRVLLAADWSTLSTVLLAAVAAVSLFGPPAVAVAEHWGEASVQTQRRDLVRRKPSPRRRIVETVLLLLVVAAVLELRRQGIGGAGQGSNLLGTFTPVLVAAFATAIAVRCYPLVLRPAAKAAATRGGPSAFLGLTGAARSAFPLAVPAFIITLTLTLGALGGMMDRAVNAGREQASWQTLGADAAVSLPADVARSTATQVASSLLKVPGVTHAAVVSTQNDYSDNATVDVVDPADYAAVTADSPWPFGNALPRSGSTSGPVPVVVGAGFHYAIGTRFAIQAAYAPHFEAVVVGTVTQTSAAPATQNAAFLVLVPAWAVADQARFWPATGILVSGNGIDQGAMNAALNRSLSTGFTSVYRADTLNALAHAPLEDLAELGYLSGLLAAAAFGVCGILLALSLTAPARGRRLMLLDALGLTPRQARIVALAETAPLTVAMVLGGLLAAAALPAVFGDALDLSAFTGIPGTSTLAFDPRIPLLAALAAAVLGGVAVALQAAAARWRGVAAQLRMGEDAEG